MNPNTQNYTDSFSGSVVRQPYFAAVPKRDLSKVWLCWRNLGHLGSTWDGDGLRHDFASCRVEGSGYNMGNLQFGLRTPLTGRTKGNALVMTVPASQVTTGTGSNWGAVTATAAELNLNGQGIRALQWCPQVDGTGKFLIIAGQPTTDAAMDHPSLGRFALWSWSGSGVPQLRIADLAPFCKYPTGVCTFLLPGSTEARVGFCERRLSDANSEEQEHFLHWPISILSN